MWIATYQGFGTGRVTKYELQGREPGNKILIADFGGPSWARWRVLQPGTGHEPYGPANFASPEAALASISI
jgi:hypothetical protein